MTVIALTTLGDKPSVVTTNDAFDRDGTAILILNAEVNQLASDRNDCNATYDLHVGAHYRDHRSNDGQSLDTNGKIPLLPKNAVIIETEEWVELPRWRFGQILPKVDLLQKGIANTPSKIDPGYKGRLLITAFNHGKQTISLCRGQKFCSLHVFGVEGAIKPYDKPGKQIESAHGATRWWRGLRDLIDANVALVVLIQTALTAGSVAIAIIALVTHL
jgi:dCTP deaminase